MGARSLLCLGLFIITLQVGENVVRETPPRGTAVHDLQVLDRDYELLLDADFLDWVNRTQTSAE